MRRSSAETALIGVIVIAFWVIAVVAWWATLWHMDTFARLGADIPIPSVLVKDGVAMGVPFAIAAVFSGLTLYEVFRHRYRALLVSVWLLCIAIVLTLLVMFAITAPMVRLCGEFVPGWPAIVDSIACGHPGGAATGCPH